MLRFKVSDDTVNKLLAFRSERKWEKFHTASNLAKSIAVEAAELLELFQWGPSIVDITKIEHEVADVLIYLVYFCELTDIDIDKIIREKIAINEANYPVEKNNGICVKERSINGVSGVFGIQDGN